jgi:hypothetical protein
MLSIIRHRQLVCQVGAFNEIAMGSTMDLDFNMTFPMGSTFVFGSWVYTVDDPDKLQSRLVEITANQATLVNHQDELEDLIETISKFYIFYPTRTRKQLKELELD